jgi:hypothetical protein
VGRIRDITKRTYSNRIAAVNFWLSSTTAVATNWITSWSSNVIYSRGRARKWPWSVWHIWTGWWRGYWRLRWHRWNRRCRSWRWWRCWHNG